MSGDDNRTPTALVAGYVLTGLWAAVLAAYLFWPGKDRWGTLLAAEPNGFGDFLAGAFAPLAFLWLALTVWLQSRELRLQREEIRQNGEALRLQADELRNSVEQQRRQTELLQSEQKFTETESLSSSLVQDINLAFEATERLANGGTYFVLSKDGGGGQHVAHVFGFRNEWKKGFSDNAAGLSFASAEVEKCLDLIKSLPSPPIAKSRSFGEISALYELLEHIDRRIEGSNEVARRLARRSKIGAFRNVLGELLNEAKAIPEQ